MRTKAMPLAQLFASEMREAARLGFKLQIAPDPKNARVRLVPDSLHAKTLCKRHDAGYIEARCPVQSEDDRLDAIGESIAEALALARQ